MTNEEALRGELQQIAATLPDGSGLLPDRVAKLAARIAELENDLSSATTLLETIRDHGLTNSLSAEIDALLPTSDSVCDKPRLTREEALAWAKVGEPAPTVLAGGEGYIHDDGTVQTEAEFAAAHGLRSSEATPGPWRIGRKLARTIYFHDRCVGMVDTPGLAIILVTAANEREEKREEPRSNEAPAEPKCTCQWVTIGNVNTSRRERLSAGCEVHRFGGVHIPLTTEQAAAMIACATPVMPVQTFITGGDRPQEAKAGESRAEIIRDAAALLRFCAGMAERNRHGSAVVEAWKSAAEQVEGCAKEAWRSPTFHGPLPADRTDNPPCDHTRTNRNDSARDGRTIMWCNECGAICWDVPRPDLSGRNLAQWERPRGVPHLDYPKVTTIQEKK